MSPRTSYRSLFRVSGPGLLVLAFLARLPAAMAPLGVILLVSSTTGSFAQAGAVAAALGIGAAAGGPVVGHLTDRYGQRRVGTAAAAVNGVALALTVLAAVSGGGLLAVALLAALVGIATPQVGPLIRVRWTALLHRRDRAELVPTAMAYEGAADEASYVAGPALVGLLALLTVPAVALLVAAALVLLAGVTFALHHTSRVRAPVPDAGRTRRMPVGAVAVLVAAMVALGAVFGATQTGVAVLADAAGHAGAAGAVYAILGVGSSTAGIATAWLPARWSLTARLPVFAGTLLAATLTLLAAGSLGSVAPALAVVGVAAAPLLVTVYALAGRVAPPARAGTVMTLLASGTVGGVALGAGAAGPLAQLAGSAGAFLVPAAAALLGVAVTVAGVAAVRHAVAAAPTGAADASTTGTAGTGTATTGTAATGPVTTGTAATGTAATGPALVPVGSGQRW